MRLNRLADTMAERVGFEPTLEFPLNTLSKRAPSTTRPPLLGGNREDGCPVRCRAGHPKVAISVASGSKNESQTTRDRISRYGASDRPSPARAGSESPRSPRGTDCCWPSEPWRHPDVPGAPRPG